MENLIVALLAREQYSVLVRYSASAMIVGVATLLRLSLAEELQHYPVLLFIPAVFLSALLFDRGSGFFATILSAVIAVYLFVDPYWSFEVDIREVVPISQGMGSRLVRFLAAQLQGDIRRVDQPAGCKTVVTLPSRQPV